ncbi:MFS transporter [Anaerosolibacter sp.]|uniref:MFS transporter n=1 Tax=Anaerosolibacter sp. TaxID=1872527 RepID=UPI0039EE07DE
MKIKKKALNFNLILYLIGRMVSDTGSSIQMMIMPLYIIDIGGTAGTIGLLGFFSFLPTLMIYPFAGVIGDRLNRKSIMVVTDLISAGVILILASISYLDMVNIALLLVVQVIISLLNGLFEPATRGMLPHLVDKDDITRANSTLASLRSVSIMLGPVIGAALYANLGITIVFLVNGISFLFSGISEMMIQYRHKKIDTVWGIGGIFNDLSEGIRYIISNKMISKLCLFLLFNYLVIQPIFSMILPLFFKNSLEYSDVQYGYLQMIIIIGALIGSLLVGGLLGKSEKLRSPLMGGSIIVSSTMIMSVVLMLPWSIAALGNNSPIYFITLAGVLCLLSIANTFIIVPIQSYIQKKTLNQYMSRVFSLVGLITRGGITLGALAYGFILEKVAMHWTLMVATVLMIIFSIGFAAILFKNNEI